MRRRSRSEPAAVRAGPRRSARFRGPRSPGPVRARAPCWAPVWRKASNRTGGEASAGSTSSAVGSASMLSFASTTWRVCSSSGGGGGVNGTEVSISWRAWPVRSPNPEVAVHVLSALSSDDGGPPSGRLFSSSSRLDRRSAVPASMPRSPSGTGRAGVGWSGADPESWPCGSPMTPERCRADHEGSASIPGIPPWELTPGAKTRASTRSMSSSSADGTGDPGAMAATGPVRSRGWESIGGGPVPGSSGSRKSTYRLSRGSAGSAGAEMLPESPVAASNPRGSSGNGTAAGSAAASGSARVGITTGRGASSPTTSSRSKVTSGPVIFRGSGRRERKSSSSDKPSGSAVSSAASAAGGAGGAALTAGTGVRATAVAAPNGPSRRSRAASISASLDCTTGIGDERRGPAPVAGGPAATPPSTGPPAAAMVGLDAGAAGRGMGAGIPARGGEGVWPGRGGEEVAAPGAAATAGAAVSAADTSSGGTGAVGSGCSPRARVSAGTIRSSCEGRSTNRSAPASLAMPWKRGPR